MGVYVRMIIYALAAGAAALGIADFDPVAGTVTFDLNSTALLICGGVSFVGTFAVGRVFKARGGSS